jgi:hypothetical protein
VGTVSVLKQVLRKNALRQQSLKEIGKTKRFMIGLLSKMWFDHERLPILCSTKLAVIADADIRRSVKDAWSMQR